MMVDDELPAGEGFFFVEKLFIYRLLQILFRSFLSLFRRVNQRHGGDNTFLALRATA